MKFTRNNQIMLAAIFGFIFISVLLVIAIRIPNPSGFQYLVFRIILSLAAGGIAVLIPGILNVKIAKFITASGALAVFVIVYFYNPSELIIESTNKYIDQSLLLQQRDEAKQYFEIALERYSFGGDELTRVINAHNKLIKLELEISSNSKDRISVLETAKTIALEIEESLETRFQLGMIGKADLLEIKSHVSEISNEINKELAKNQKENR